MAHDDYEDGYDVSNVLSDTISNSFGANTNQGVVTVFGKNIHVGPLLAGIIDTALAGAIQQVGEFSGRYARKQTMSFAANKVWRNENNQHKVAIAGEVVDLSMRVALPVLDLGTSVLSATKVGYRNMSALKDQASTVLAANNHMKVGVGGVMTTKFSALQHQRAMVMRESRGKVVTGATVALRHIPGAFVNYWSYKKDRIMDPDRITATVALNADEGKKAAIEAKKAKYISMDDRLENGQLPTSNQPNNVPSLLGDAKINAQGLTLQSLWTNSVHLFKPKKNKLSDLAKTGTGEARLVAAAIGGSVSDYADQHFNKKYKMQDSAWNRIMDLKERVSAGGETSDSIEEYVRAVFVQHAVDMKLKQLPRGHKFDRIVESVSTAIVHDNLMPDALVELLDNKKVINYGKTGITYGSTSNADVAVSELIEKYTAKVGQKQFYEQASFTADDVKNTYKNLSEEEKPIFALLFPTGILENLGIERKELAEYREFGREHLVQEVATILSNMMSADREDLKKSGVKKEVLDELEAMEVDFVRAAKRGRLNSYVQDNLSDMQAVVRDAAVTSGPNFWQNYVLEKGKEEEMSTETPDARRGIKPRGSYKEESLSGAGRGRDFD